MWTTWDSHYDIYCYMREQWWCLWICVLAKSEFLHSDRGFPGFPLHRTFLIFFSGMASYFVISLRSANAPICCTSRRQMRRCSRDSWNGARPVDETTTTRKRYGNVSRRSMTNPHQFWRSTRTWWKRCIFSSSIQSQFRQSGCITYLCAFSIRFTSVIYSFFFCLVTLN